MGREEDLGQFGYCGRLKWKRGQHMPIKPDTSMLQHHRWLRITVRLGSARLTLVWLVFVCELCIFYLLVMLVLEPAAIAKLPILRKGEGYYTNPRWHFTGTVLTSPPVCFSLLQRRGRLNYKQTDSDWCLVAGTQEILSSLLGYTQEMFPDESKKLIFGHNYYVIYVDLRTRALNCHICLS
jgi:hypothetical protein